MIVNLIILNVIGLLFYNFYEHKCKTIFQYCILFLTPCSFCYAQVQAINEILEEKLPFEKWVLLTTNGQGLFIQGNPIVSGLLLNKAQKLSSKFPPSIFTLKTILYKNANEILHLHNVKDAKVAFGQLSKVEKNIEMLSEMDQVVLYSSLSNVANSVEDFKRGISYSGSCTKILKTMIDEPHPFLIFLQKECQLQSLIYYTSINQYMSIVDDVDSLFKYYETLHKSNPVSANNHMFMLARMSALAQDYDRALEMYHSILNITRPTCLTTSKIKVYLALSKLYELKGIEVKSQIYQEYAKTQMQAKKDKKCLKTF